jgi:hypothetical protein
LWVGNNPVKAGIFGEIFGNFAVFCGFLRAFWEKWGGSLRFFGGEIRRA